MALNNGVRLDAESLSDMVDSLLDHSYIAHTGPIYRKGVSMATRVHNAPQMAICILHTIHVSVF
jgi:hypothetical protein